MPSHSVADKPPAVARLTNGLPLRRVNARRTASEPSDAIGDSLTSALSIAERVLKDGPGLGAVHGHETIPGWQTKTGETEGTHSALT